jgi:sulfur-carrier protein
MSVLVNLPFVLKGMSGTCEQIEVEGRTVAEAVEGALRGRPSLLRQCRDSEALASGLVKIFLDDEDVRYLGGLDTPVEPGDTLTIVASPEPSDLLP